MEKRTEEGKRRHDLGKKIWYAEKRANKREHELQNGAELGYPGVCISDYWKKKILNGTTQILDMKDGTFLPFRKKANGYWYNNSNGVKYLHREKLKQYLGMTDEEMKIYEVHHIDENKDNNDISNLKLVTKKEHSEIHSRTLTDEQREARRKNMNEKARPVAIAWHKSEEGLKWHKERGNNNRYRK